MTARPPLPVTVLTGFLGAGKTTFLRRLLREPHGQRISVIMNELGQAGIDSVPQLFVELTDGCVCCLRNPELIAALTDQWARGDIDRVIVETTGLADPLPLSWTLARPDLAHAARLDAVITIVDAAHERDTRVAEWEAQVKCADLIVLAKLDLVDAPTAAQVRRDVQELNPRAGLLELTPGAPLPLGIILDAEHEHEHEHERRPGRHSDFAVVSLAAKVRYAADPFEDLLETLPRDIFRAKGIVALDDGRWAAFHVVGGRVELDLGVPPPAHGESRIVLFGRGLERERAAALFDGTRVP